MTKSSDQRSYFKYVTPKTAKVILETGSLRWSAPRLFNDPFDIQFDMHVEYNEKTLVTDVIAELWRTYSQKIEFEPKNRLGYFVKEMSIKTPSISRPDFEEAVRKGVTESLSAQKLALPKLHAWSQDQLKRTLILCLSESPSNILMWAHYADCHRGASLRFKTLAESSWAAAQPVEYRQKMPLLFDHDELLKFLTGRTRIDPDRFKNESLLTKSIDWRYEKEWRVIWAGTETKEYEDTKFNPKELSGIYFGCRTDQNDIDELTDLAKNLNPDVEVFRGRKSERSFAVDFSLS